jgi:glycosyltransferase involved in cell wall biosynthesis
MTGWRQDVPRLIRGFDLLAHSSLWEGLPCVFSQALASEVPVVATDVAGAREIIQTGKNGVLVPPAQPRQLAQALIRLLEKPALARKLKKHARSSTRVFTFPTMQKQILKLYQKQAKIILKITKTK